MSSVRQVLASQHGEPPTKKVKPNTSDFISLDFIPLGDDNPKEVVKIEDEDEDEEVVVVSNVNGIKRPVWVKNHINLQSLTLKEEVLHFFDWIKPSPAEHILKEYVITQITDVIKRMWKDAKVETFGSHKTNISLPTSDIDIMVYNAGHSSDNDNGRWHPEPLRELFHELEFEHKDKFSYIKLIDQARVPIIKLISSIATNEIKLDITISTDDTLPSSVAISSYLKEYPVLRPLILTLKQFLFQFNLHDTYTGGIGSFALALMCISLLQLRSSVKKNCRANFTAGLGGGKRGTQLLELLIEADDIGSLLAAFFYLYAKVFDMKNYGISVRENGQYFRKQDKGWENARYPFQLCLEDPTDSQNDVGKNSFNISAIRSVFNNAFMRITGSDEDIAQRFPRLLRMTKLARIITVDDEIIKRRERVGGLVGALMLSEANEENNKNNNNNKNNDKKNNNTTTNTTTPAKSPKSVQKRKWDF